MTLDIRWFAPAAIVAMVSADCIAVPYMSFAQAQEFIAAPVSLTAEQIQRLTQQSGVDVRSAHFKVWQAQAAGKFLGWFILD